MGTIIKKPHFTFWCNKSTKLSLATKQPKSKGILGRFFVKKNKPFKNCIPSLEKKLKKSRGQLKSYRSISSINTKNEKLQKIYLQALATEDHKLIKRSLLDFREEIARKYPEVPTKEEQDNNYQKFIDISARYSFVGNRETQETKLGIKSNYKQLDDLYVIFNLAYQQEYSVGDDAFSTTLMTSFLYTDNDPKAKFIREDCLSIKAYNSIEKAIESLQAQKKEFLANSTGSSSTIKTRVAGYTNEIDRLKSIAKDDRTKLKTSEEVVRDICNRQLELNNDELNKRVAFYVRSMSGDANSITDEIMRFSTPLIEKTSEKVERDLKVFRKIVAGYVAKHI